MVSFKKKTDLIFGRASHSNHTKGGAMNFGRKTFYRQPYWSKHIWHFTDRHLADRHFAGTMFGWQNYYRVILVDSQLSATPASKLRRPNVFRSNAFRSKDVGRSSRSSWKLPLIFIYFFELLLQLHLAATEKLFTAVNYNSKLDCLSLKKRGVGKTTLLLSLHFRRIFIAIKQKNSKK
jgi:hypothetical protein